MSGVFAEETREGSALCLSGGGYRAMLFHVGVLWRLYELEKLQSLTRISSVSGGSITAAHLGVKWKGLSFEPDRLQKDFVPLVVSPIRALASKTIDRGAILRGLAWRGSVSSKIAKAYRKHLFGNGTLQEFPDNPRIVLNSTNIQSGALCRFSKPYMWDYRVGKIANPRIELAVAVGA